MVTLAALHWPHGGLSTALPPAWAHLTVQLDVLGKERVDLGEGAAEAPGLDVDQVLQRVHLIILHKVLPVLELWANGAL